MMLRPRSTIAVSVMAPMCPTRTTGHSPVSADQMRNCMSAPPLRTTTPDGKKLHVYTSPMCPQRVRYKRASHHMSPKRKSKHAGRMAGSDSLGHCHAQFPIHVVYFLCRHQHQGLLLWCPIPLSVKITKQILGCLLGIQKRLSTLHWLVAHYPPKKFPPGTLSEVVIEWDCSNFNFVAKYSSCIQYIL